MTRASGNDARRVIVVGAGPAGVRCAEALVAAGLRPIVIDESVRDGGQIYRRQPEEFTRSYATLYGTEARRAQHLHESFDALRGRIDYRPHTLVWNVSGDRAHLLQGARSESLRFDALIVCAGATDRLMPVDGWNAAGVCSLGGAQIALKSQACAIGREVVFAGTGPLLYLVAAQYAKAGAKVAAVLDTSRFSLRVRALPGLLARPGVVLKGLVLLARLKRAGVRIETGVNLLQVTAHAEKGVDGIAFHDARGGLHTLRCDAVALGYHLRPEMQLADLAGCAFHFDEATRQWLPQIDADGRSSIDRVYLAGDGARVLGADGAEAAGRLAALAALHDCGLEVPAREIESLRRTLRRMDRFRRGLARAFPWPHEQASALPDDAVVCRCETIRAGELRRVARAMDAQEINRAKAFSRVGMGRCQGRYCAHAAAEVLADAARLPVESVGRMRAQAPVKPLTIAAEESAA